MTPRRRYNATEDAINDIQYYLEKYSISNADWNDVETTLFDLDDAAYNDGQNSLGYTSREGGSNYARNTSRHPRLAPVGGGHR